MSLYLFKKKLSYFTMIIDCGNMKRCETITFGNVQDTSGFRKQLLHSSGMCKEETISYKRYKVENKTLTVWTGLRVGGPVKRMTNT